MTEPDFLVDTRAGYDAMAVEYTEHAQREWDRMPLERALVDLFAEYVLTSGNLTVADIGCGPGRLTALLGRRGLEAYGIDLSPVMVELARKSYPELRFEVGSMLDLDVPSGSLGGVLAFYSIIHVPWELRAQVFAEFFRVLAPGGHLMLAFQVGDDCRHRTEAFGHAISVSWHRQQPADLAELLEHAGFDVQTQVVRPPTPELELAPQGFMFARKPDAA